MSGECIFSWVGAKSFFLGCSFCFVLFLFEADTQLARQVHQKRTQVGCSNKVDRSRLALPLLVLFQCFVLWLLFWSRHTHTQIYKQTMNRTKHTWTTTYLLWIGINPRNGHYTPGAAILACSSFFPFFLSVQFSSVCRSFVLTLCIFKAQNYVLAWTLTKRVV